MGYFTWNFANHNNERKLYYGTRGYVACPDGTYLKEEYYDGYGIFGGKDIYDLVVDWNKDNLVDILSNKNYKLHCDGSRLIPVAQAFIEGKSEEEIRKIYAEVGGPFARSVPQDWKRNIGIAIACYDEDNARLKYPIKITSNMKYKYEDLPSSNSCQ